ncbi:hypothetical protein BZG36_02018 [Bifiguratus adelaidae]|uniref:Mitochondrial import inner membrane translocase subunit TIM50 n=1 Tax=Bifiguratus adelaidae TaxID=1938954 RepID=A0A261Y4J7_9FUNG|nr:hypothetical protein BZG36_02018 [Bifiguratus adelaidae]
MTRHGYKQGSTSLEQTRNNDLDAHYARSESNQNAASTPIETAREDAGTDLGGIQADLKADNDLDTTSVSKSEQSRRSVSVDPEYLRHVDQQTTAGQMGRKKLLILDLNGTLFYRPRGSGPNRRIFNRPHIHTFLHYALSHYVVMVWSSAQAYNVDRMLDKFGLYKHHVSAVWNRSSFNLSREEFKRKTLTIKDLNLVWKENDTTPFLRRNALLETTEASHMSNDPSVSRHVPSDDMDGHVFYPSHFFDQSNTVLLDDSPDKAQLQPYNAIHMPEFDGKRFHWGRDSELLSVIAYLEKLEKHDNVSWYIKHHPYQPSHAEVPGTIHPEEASPDGTRSANSSAQDLDDEQFNVRWRFPSSSMELQRIDHYAGPHPPYAYPLKLAPTPHLLIPGSCETTS